MKASLIFGLTCCAVFGAHSTQAEEMQAPPACDCQAASAPCEQLAVPQPPSASMRAMMLGGGILVAAGIPMVGLGIWGSTIKEEGGILQGMGYGIGGGLLAVGGPLLGVGIGKTQEYRWALARALSVPQLHEEALAEVKRSVERERTTMIISGAMAGLGASMVAIGSALLFSNSGMYAQDDLGGFSFGLVVFGSMLGYSSLFPLFWSAGSYVAYKSMLNGERIASKPLVSNLALAPLLSSGLYGLSLSGRWN